MTIQELHNGFDISVRAYNVCVNLGLTTVDELKVFYKQHGSFISARNCGTKTNDELVSIMADFGKASAVRPQPQSRLMDFATSLDEQVFDQFLLQKFSSLSVRAQNAVLIPLDGRSPRFELLKSGFLADTFNPEELKNVGRLTSPELVDFRQALLEFYNALNSNSLSANEKARILLNSIVGFDCDNDQYLTRLNERTFPILKFVNGYAGEIFALNEVDEYILRNRLYLLEQQFTMEDLAKQFKLSRERIRQKSIAIFEKVEAASETLEKLLPYSEYSVLRSEPFVKLSDLENPNLLAREIKETSPVLASYVLGVILRDHFYSFCPLDRFRRPEDVQYYLKYDQVKRIKGSYLVRDDVISKLELYAFYQSAIELFCQRRSEEQRFAIASLIKSRPTADVVAFISLLMQEEFGISVLEGSIVFPRNTNKLVFEYVVEALEKLNGPSHISDILAEVLKIHPDYDSGEEALRGSLGNHKEEFIYFGRSSTYGLKKWESEKKNIRGGTIKKIIEDYLDPLTEPKHINEIVNHVRKYRPTTSIKSIITNLKLDPKAKFKFFGKGFIGLNRKDYGKSAFGVEVKSAGEIDWEKIVDLVF